MLGTKNIVAFVPTTDFEKARSFYEGVLGLRFVNEDGFALVLDANGITVRVSKVPDFKPLPYTILGWEVSGIESDVAALRERGVQLLVGGEKRRHLRVDHLIERLLRGERGGDEKKREEESFHIAELISLTRDRDRTHQRFPERGP